MSKVELLPHNEEGYADLVKCLKDNQVATLNRATGTGKSFIGLKYLYEHRDKRILIIAPTYPILDQWTEDHMEELGINRSEFKKLDTMIYSNLLRVNNIDKLANQYDIVLLDEYHRCGSQQWGKKVKELKDAIIEDSNKRIIGTTATEIRYLDNERNMKDILFDGIEASRLSLADAILRGILPAPYYICFDFETLEVVDTLIKRLMNGLPSYCEEKRDIIFRLMQIKEKLVRELFENNEVRRYINSGEKYLAFSTTKSDIKIDREKIERIFLNIPYQEFFVHSKNTKEHNKKQLEMFKADSSVTSILYSIAILNEGVHVKGVSGIFMFRKTTSPIVYFQQLGRLLSFSRRKDRVYVFDYAGNIKNHKVIYNLYNEVSTRAKELLNTDPVNRERYLSILDNFKIVDKTSSILEELREYSEKYSKNELIKMSLESALKILEGDRKPSYLDTYLIERDIRKYFKHIDKNLFVRIKNAEGIKKPNLFNLEEHEFERLLNGYNTIDELVHNKYKHMFEKIRNYIDTNYSIPSLFSDDEDEFLLAVDLYNNFKKLGNSNCRFVKNAVDDSTSIFEKITYGYIEDNIDYDELIEEINAVINLKQVISQNVINALKAAVKLNLYKDVNKLSSLITKLEKYNKKLLLLQMANDFEEQSFSVYVNSIAGENSPLMEAVFKELEALIEKDGLEKVLEDVYKEIENFIKTYGYIPSFKKSRGLSDFENKTSSLLACKMNVLERAFETYGYLDKIDNLILNVEIEALEKITDNIIEFIERNDGFLPSTKSKDIYEKNLAEYFIRIERRKTTHAYQRLIPYLKNFEKIKREFAENVAEGKFINTDKELSVVERCEKVKEYLTSSELTKVSSGMRLRLIINFLVNHNYELPSLKNPNLEEKEIARIFSYIKNRMSPIQFTLLSEHLKKQDEYKELFIEKYQKYVKEHGKIPRVIGSAEECELAYSYNRWLPYIDKEVLNRISKNSIVDCVIKFLEQNNYEYPSQRNGGLEGTLAFEFSRIKNKLDVENIVKLEAYNFKINDRKLSFLEKLREFIQLNGCMPKKDTNEDLFKSLNRWLPYLSSEEKSSIRLDEIQKNFVEYFVKNNYEYPSVKNNNAEEERMARIYINNKELLDTLLKEFETEIASAKQAFIDRYTSFTSANKRVPLLSEESEIELIHSYNRWLPFLSKAEQKQLEIKGVSKFSAMENAYQMMKQKRK